MKNKLFRIRFSHYDPVTGRQINSTYETVTGESLISVREAYKTNDLHKVLTAVVSL